MDDVLAVMPSGFGRDGGRALTRRAALLGGLGLVALGAGAGLERFLSVQPDPLNAAGTIYRFGFADLPKPGAEPLYIRTARAFLINLRPGEGGIDLAGKGEFAGSERGGLLALSERCPHLGCSIRWRTPFLFLGRTDWFRCPCCGATFTIGGLRVFGPSPRSMDTIPLTFDRYAGLLIHIRNVRLGGMDDPQRVVPLR
jgi:cytochrome b6-f complex iron-sulfur subunit